CEAKTRDIGVGVERKPRDAAQVVGVAVAEMGGQYRAAHLAELEPARRHAAAAERERAAQPLRPCRAAVIDPGAGLDQRLGALEIGLDLAPRERPAGIGQPVAGLEVDVVEGPAPAAPMVGAAAQIAQPRAFELEVRIAALAA